MMQAMRQNTKWIMLAVAVAFVALMVFDWGMDLSGRSGTQLTGGEVGRVNGEPITYEEWNAVYRQLYDQQSQYSDDPIGAAMVRQIEDAAFEQVVMQRLVAQELRRRGIVVTDEEVLMAARTEPPPELRNNEMFMTDGQFDMAKYQQFLSSPALGTDVLLSLEAYYRDAIPRSKLFYRQTAGVYVTDDELWQIWRDTRDAATIRYFAFNPETLVTDAEITLTEAEIGAWYREHSDEFIRPARATVKYVTMDRVPNAADTAAAIERVNRLRAEIAGGADFGEVAQRESADSASARDGGQMTVWKGLTVAPFEEAAFGQPVGQLGQPVLSQYGYHLIRVDRRTADTAYVRHILMPVELTFARDTELLDRADSLDVLTETLGLDSIGKNLGLTVGETEMIPGLSFLPGVGDASDGAYWVFEEAEVGDVSEVLETQSAYYALELVARDEERTLTLQEATPSIRAGLIRQKKIERTKERAREAVDRIRAGQTIDAVAESLGMEVQDAGPFTRADFVPGMGRMNAAIGTAFGLRPGETSGAVEANQQVYVIHVVSREDADRSAWEQQKEEQRGRVAQALSQQRWESYLSALRTTAQVVDNRAELERQSAAAAAATATN